MAIVVWSLAPLLVTYCADVPLFLLLGISCLATFGAFAAQWIARGESVIGNLRIGPEALAVGALGNGVFRGLFWPALLMVNPVEASLISDIWPTAIVLLAVLLGGRAMGARHMAGAIAALAGLAVLTSDGAAIFARFSAGHAMALGSALVWAIYVAMAQRDERYGGNAAAAGFLVSGVAFLAASALLERPWEATASGLAFVLGAALCGSGGRILWEIGAHHGKGRTLELASLFMPLAGAFWLIAFGRSALTVNVALGALLVFAAAVCVSPAARRPNIVRIQGIED